MIEWSSFNAEEMKQSEREVRSLRTKNKARAYTRLFRS